MSEKSDFINIQPGVGMYALFPALPYKPWIAIGELVDNAVDSYIKNRKALLNLHPNYKLKIEINIDQGVEPRIVIEDNAAGIPKDRVEYAFTPAAPNPDKSGIGRYGIGMKSASGWYSKFYVITSKALGESIRRTVTFDIDDIIKSGVEKIKPVESEADLNDHGTRIILSKLNKGIPQGQTLGKLKRYLSSMYRQFIREGNVEIYVSGEKLSYQVPELLSAPFWPDAKGPKDGLKPQIWSERFSIELVESWKSDNSPDKSQVPPIVEGWVGILAKGDNRRSGIALSWRGKIIYGAGSMADELEEVYRPVQLFQTRSSNQFLRLIGEIDVSDLEVTAFKDQVVWKTGQEEELLEKLAAKLNEGLTPLLPMAKNFRATYRGPNISKKIEEALDSATSAIKEEFENKSGPLNSEFNLDINSDAKDNIVSNETVSRRIEIGDEILTLEVIDAPYDPALLIIRKLEGENVIAFNRNHPYVNSFASLPDSDLDPVLRMALSIGLTEIRARAAGIQSSSYYRQSINDLLRGRLSTRID